MKTLIANPGRFLARCPTAERKSRPCGSCQKSSRKSRPSCTLAGRCLAPLRSRASSINRIQTYIAWAHRAKRLPRSATVASPSQRLKARSCQPSSDFCNASMVRYAGASHVRHEGYWQGTDDGTTARFHLARHGNGSCVGVASSLSLLPQAKALPHEALHKPNQSHPSISHKVVRSINPILRALARPKPVASRTHCTHACHTSM